MQSVVRRVAGGFLLFLLGSSMSAGAALAVVPELPLPDVEVQAPALPSLPAPPVEVPATPQLSAPPAAPAPAPTGGGVPSVGYGPSLETGTVVSTESVGTAISGGGPSGGLTFGPSGGQASAKRSARARARRRAAARRHERSFRQEVRRHAPCFYGLGDFERRVLALRSGLRSARASSRGRVARRLGVSRRRVLRAERRGLRRLRRTNRSDGCAFSANRRTSGVEIAVKMLDGNSMALALALAALPAESKPAAAQAKPDRQAVAGERESGGERASGDDAERAGLLPLDSEVEGDGLNAALIAALLAAVLLAGVTWLLAQRRRTAPEGAPSAVGDPARDRWSRSEQELGPAPWDRPESGPAAPQQEAASKEPRPARGEPAPQKGNGAPTDGHGRRLRSRNR
jgi:hypothetical protein